MGVPVAHDVRRRVDGIPAYASCGSLLPAAARAESALRLREEGFRALKIRVDPRRLEDGLAAVDRDPSTRSSDTMAIMVDLNQGWRMAGDTTPAIDWETARSIASQLAELDVLWLEEPLDGTDLAGLAALREAVPGIKIAGGEMTRTFREIVAAIDADAFDVHQPDVVLAAGMANGRTGRGAGTGQGPLVLAAHLDERDRAAGEPPRRGGRRWRAVHRVPVRPARLDPRAARLHARRAASARRRRHPARPAAAGDRGGPRRGRPAAVRGVTDFDAEAGGRRRRPSRMQTPWRPPASDVGAAAGGRPASGAGCPQQRPWAQPRMRYKPTEVVSADELESIHEASLQVLEEIGMDFLDEEARDLLAAAGARVEPGKERVRFDRAMVEERIKTAPSSFTLHARNPEHHLEIGGDWMAFGSVASAPNVSDLDRGRRVGNHADYQNLIRLCQMLNVVHFFAGYPVEPIDLHASVRHLDAVFDLLTLADKPIHAYSLGRQRITDAMEMARIARGIDDETFDREPSLFTVINSSSPLRLDTPMLHGILEMSAVATRSSS